MPLSNVPDVDIDPSGTFKYVLIKCTDPSSKEEKHIVRGYGRCTFHDDIFQEVRGAVGSECKLKCVGGGRIKHGNKDLFVYGYSQGYGKADHTITVDILKKRYPDYHITYSDEVIVEKMLCLRAVFGRSVAIKNQPLITSFMRAAIMEHLAHTMPLSNVPDVDIDSSGTFKYILIKCTDDSSREEKHIVRGYARCEYHDGIFKEVEKAIGSECNLKCVGGGKIKHEDKKITVFGESQGFGKADHSITVGILKKRYPDYNITQSD
ncbi:unnamed protein product [Cylicocyclus nassatus]|uniref:Sex-regulated protein janus-A n=1 Tax=Cylicocyclus nassatus TaxID=53992 RepID=A0AA36GL30_CYLNA|nr:unnamed protein product [Cylicocyclus nassatus]